MPKSAGKEHFKPKQFPDDRELWASRGLHGCQRMAASIRTREKHLRFLDVPQLLKHTLGFATTDAPFELYYLYYDVDGRETSVHRAELNDFEKAIGGDFQFRVGTYQEVYSRIHTSAAEAGASYLAYLDARYFA